MNQSTLHLDRPATGHPAQHQANDAFQDDVLFSLGSPDRAPEAKAQDTARMGSDLLPEIVPAKSEKLNALAGVVLVSSTSHIHAIPHRAERAVDPLQGVSFATKRSPSLCPVRLIADPDTSGFCVVVDGVPGANPDGVSITTAHYRVLAALIKAFPEGLTAFDLARSRKTRVADPGKAIREVISRERALEKVLHTPGKARRGILGKYRIKPAPVAVAQPIPRE